MCWSRKKILMFSSGNASVTLTSRFAPYFVTVTRPCGSQRPRPRRVALHIMKRTLFFLALAAFLLAQPNSPRLSSDLVKDLPVRNILGTFSSGRIADVAVDPKNRSTWYVATASGGLWKTSNHGLSFQPIFDDGGSYSLGCVAVDPKNSDIVWLGTGENQAQRAIGYGDGIYKSTDAGKTWKNTGLPNSEHIGKIWI